MAFNIDRNRKRNSVFGTRKLNTEGTNYFNNITAEQEHNEQEYNNKIPDEERILTIPVNKISLNQFNKFRDFDSDEANAITSLAQSIEMCGLLNPLQVYLNPENADEYILVAGERRYRAITEILGWDNVKCILQPYSDGTDMVINLYVENLQKRHLPPSALIECYKEVRNLVTKKYPNLSEAEYDNHCCTIMNLSARQVARYKQIAKNLNTLEDYGVDISNVDLENKSLTEIINELNSKVKSYKSPEADISEDTSTIHADNISPSENSDYTEKNSQEYNDESVFGNDDFSEDYGAYSTNSEEYDTVTYTDENKDTDKDTDTDNSYNIDQLDEKMSDVKTSSSEPLRYTVFEGKSLKTGDTVRGTGYKIKGRFCIISYNEVNNSLEIDFVDKNSVNVIGNIECFDD